MGDELENCFKSELTIAFVVNSVVVSWQREGNRVRWSIVKDFEKEGHASRTFGALKRLDSAGGRVRHAKKMRCYLILLLLSIG